MIQIGAAPEYFLALLLILARVGGVMTFAPFWSSFAVSPRIRIILSLVLSLLLFPLLADRLPTIPMAPVSVALVIAGELAIGMALGLVGQIFMGALELAGHLIGFQMGFSLVNVIDPQSQVEVSVLSVFYGLAGLTLFIIFDAHHWYLQAMAESYNIVPVAGVELNAALVQEMVGIAGRMFITGIQLALPVAAVGILVDILLGVIGRAAPQIHILIAGLPVKVLVGFTMLTLTGGVLAPFLRERLAEFRIDLQTVLRLLAP